MQVSASVPILDINSSTNIKEFTVTEISHIIKNLIETNFGYIRVKGEISNLKIASSGHGYFNLKDNMSVLCCTCWRPILSKIDFSLVDGLEVVIAGKLTSYSGQSRYQLSVETIKPAGLGAMMQILDERRERLKKEGLFDHIHKKSLPFLPKKIGIITSISGAVIKDIIHRITDRFPSSILIWPTAVQGNGAAEEITSAIEGFNALNDQRPDVIIIARGGGSIEDLWCFNEEIVIRAAFASNIPIISAIGHETDFTLLDFVADLRAPTPTAGAEFVVPVRANVLYTINSHYNYLRQKLSQVIRHYKHIINNFERIIGYPSNYIKHLEQRIDDIQLRLNSSLPNLLSQKIIAVGRYKFANDLANKITDYRYLKLNYQNNYLNNLSNNLLKTFQYKLQLSSKILNSLDYNNVLKRGFAIVRHENGKLIGLAKELKDDDRFIVKFYDDEIIAKKSNL